MILLIALIPATMLCMAGYGVLFLARRSDGSFQAFGKYLGFWAFTLAALLVLAGVIGAARGGRYMQQMRVHHRAFVQQGQPMPQGPRPPQAQTPGGPPQAAPAPMPAPAPNGPAPNGPAPSGR
jgi:hypothetical protein